MKQQPNWPIGDNLLEIVVTITTSFTSTQSPFIYSYHSPTMSVHSILQILIVMGDVEAVSLCLVL